MTLGTGAQLGPYEILSPLGAGGMCEVYLAEDMQIRQRKGASVQTDAVDGEQAGADRISQDAVIW